jgi:hypothetical protein
VGGCGQAGALEAEPPVAGLTVGRPDAREEGQAGGAHADVVEATSLGREAWDGWCW